MVILVYLITNINNNLKKITDFQQHKQFIETLLSTLSAKIAVTISVEEFESEVKKIADLLQQRNLNLLGIEQKIPMVKQNNFMKIKKNNY
jgi:ACT domain-containing protein